MPVPRETSVVKKLLLAAAPVSTNSVKMADISNFFIKSPPCLRPIINAEVLKVLQEQLNDMQNYKAILRNSSVNRV